MRACATHARLERMTADPNVLVERHTENSWIASQIRERARRENLDAKPLERALISPVERERMFAREILCDRYDIVDLVGERDDIPRRARVEFSIQPGWLGAGWLENLGRYRAAVTQKHHV